MFDGLLSEPYNQQVLDLLFAVADWHSLAKLRMKTDETLELMDEGTTFLGEKFRDFQLVTCSNFKTKELEREATARKRRAAKAKASTKNQTTPANALSASVPLQGCAMQPTVSTHPEPESFAAASSWPGMVIGRSDGAGTRVEPSSPAQSLCNTTVNPSRAESHTSSSHWKQPRREPSKHRSDTATRREVRFNLLTYKHHALGDYVRTIKRYGTTDSYSTEPVSPPHYLTALPPGLILTLG